MRTWPWVAALVAVVFGASYLAYAHPRGAPSGARTYYSGSVAIAPASLAERVARLEARGCRPMNGGSVGAACVFERASAGPSDPPGLVVHPRGLGFGPSEVVITGGRLHAAKDLPGSPDEEAYRRAVREDVSQLGEAVQIVEGTWTMSEIKYPWTVRY
jgi:hypothetical protein